MADGDLEERRRRGLELQARVPQPRWGRKKQPSEAADLAEVGWFAADAGIVGLVLAAVLGAAALFVRRRHHRSAGKS